jgi:hypothetical protein
MVASRDWNSPLLQGPFPLNSRSVDVHLCEGAPAVFIVGRMRAGRFVGHYVGSAGEDAARQLKWLAGRYTAFKFMRCGSTHDAFLLECALYHELGASRLDNETHPTREAGVDWACPLCRIFDPSSGDEQADRR